MTVAKPLLAALGISACAVAQDQGVQDQGVQYEDVVLDAWPMDPNNVLPTGTVTVRSYSPFRIPYLRSCVETYKDYNADHGKILGSMGCQEWQGYRVVV
jgi:hypothetical protein